MPDAVDKRLAEDPEALLASLDPETAKIVGRFLDEGTVRRKTKVPTRAGAKPVPCRGLPDRKPTGRPSLRELSRERLAAGERDPWRLLRIVTLRTSRRCHFCSERRSEGSEMGEVMDSFTKRWCCTSCLPGVVRGTRT